MRWCGEHGIFAMGDYSAGVVLNDLLHSDVKDIGKFGGLVGKPPVVKFARSKGHTCGAALGSKFHHMAGETENWTHNGVVGGAMSNDFTFNAIFLDGEGEVAVSEASDIGQSKKKKAKKRRLRRHLLFGQNDLWCCQRWKRIESRISLTLAGGGSLFW
eukprot:15365597-Ditylum_brightwellii.AAC.1